MGQSVPRYGPTRACLCTLEKLSVPYFWARDLTEHSTETSDPSRLTFGELQQPLECTYPAGDGTLTASLLACCFSARSAGHPACEIVFSFTLRLLSRKLVGIVKL